ncbi:hypothetical protein F383_05508 [Gossypium arboreum]|uniref:Uncharacterized protein n=1 Tax=Gossypium arboreum TaxID=29729 RepID=A0A0B0PF18_GOSAR|nr:hypothetical protein F383_05508 [Gossypium arboreum]
MHLGQFNPRGISIIYLLGVKL